MNFGPVVVDTNVVVSGLITKDPRSPTSRILDGMLQARFPFLLSTELLSEYRAVMLRDNIKKLHGLTNKEVDRILTDIAMNAIVRDPRETESSPIDEGDRHLWHLLAEHPGSILITGDRTLIRSPPTKERALSPAAFLKRLETEA